MKKLLLLLLLSLGFVGSAYACYSSSIVKPQPFMGNNGEIFQLSDGSVWEVKYEYEYLYEYYPSITACPNEGFIIIDGKKLNATTVSSSASGGSSNVIESRIEGEFEGYDYGNLYKLTNGQVWQQTSAKYRYRYKYRPQVLIYSGMMQVDGMSDSVRVQRIR
jgi:hypothetical protein